jgi:DNA polymerase-1
MRMADFEARAQELVGRPFNLGSPKQIGDVLFGEMALKGGKKTATGQWSTDSDVLESLALEHELPRVLLDCRVHTSYALAATRRAACRPTNRTCRTSRSAPRRAARSAAFIAAPGHKLVSPTTARSNCACWPRSPISRS